MSALPETWAAAVARLAAAVSGDDGDAIVWQYVAEALDALYGVPDPSLLPRGSRQAAFRRLLGVMLTLEDIPGDLAFSLHLRATLAAAFSRYFGGVALDGPPWRIGPLEDDRPAYRDCVAAADFAAVAS